jgi:hypothetical protein
LRTARESVSQRNETLRQARITQIRLAKFGTCPVICLVLVDQSRLPLRTEWAKVNIDIDGLQAIIHHSARKMWVIVRPVGTVSGTSTVLPSSHATSFDGGH